MTIGNVNQTAGVASGNVSSQATTIGWTPAVGNVLTMWVGCNCANQTARTLTVSGWTKVAQGQQNATSTNSALGGFFWRISDGTEGASPPTISIAGATALPRWVITELPGIAGGAVDTINTNITPTFAAFLGYTHGNTSATDNCPTLTMPSEQAYVTSAVMGRAQASLTITSWGGGASTDFNTSSGATGVALTGAQAFAGTSGTSVTHTATYTDSTGNPCQVLGSIAFVIGGKSIVLDDRRVRRNSLLRR